MKKKKTVKIKPLKEGETIALPCNAKIKIGKLYPTLEMIGFETNSPIGPSDTKNWYHVPIKVSSIPALIEILLRAEETFKKR